MASSNFCVIQTEGWAGWWKETRRFRFQIYVSIILFFLSAVLAYPIVRSLFFIVRRATPKRLMWPDEARSLMMWQTALLCRAGLLWIALRVSGLSIFLCQWPPWLFWLCFIIWLDAAGNVLREVIVRKGVKGYNDDEKPGRLTLLYEGTTLAKMLLLVFVVYTYYIASFVQDDNSLRVISSTGFFLAIALSLLPLFRNVMGAHYMFLNNMLRLRSRVRLHGNVYGSISEAPLGFLVVETDDKLKTFVPAGGSVTTPTTVYNDQISALQLDITLPPQIPPSEVRAFVQELDRLAMEKSRTGNTSRQSLILGRNSSDASRASQQPREPSKLALKWEWKEQIETLDRARVHEHIIELSTTQRWVVHFKTFVQAKHESTMVELRTLYIEDIMQLKQEWLVAHEESRIGRT